MDFQKPGAIIQKLDICIQKPWDGTKGTTHLFIINSITPAISAKAGYFKQYPLASVCSLTLRKHYCGSSLQVASKEDTGNREKIMNRKLKWYWPRWGGGQSSFHLLHWVLVASALTTRSSCKEKLLHCRVQPVSLLSTFSSFISRTASSWSCLGPSLALLLSHLNSFNWEILYYVPCNDLEIFCSFVIFMHPGPHHTNFSTHSESLLTCSLTPYRPFSLQQPEWYL